MKTVRMRTALIVAVLAAALLVPATATASAFSFEKSLVNGFSPVAWATPDVSGNWVVWSQKSTAPGSLVQIAALNMKTNVVKVIGTDATFNLLEPRISGNWVVWWGDGDIHAKNLSTGATKNITNDGLSPIDSSPVISGTKVVWTSYNGTNWDIWWKDLATSAPKAALVTGAGDQDEPSINGSRVAYRDKVIPSIGQIKVKTIGGGTKLITNNLLDQDVPSIGSHLVAWRVNVGGVWKIRYYNYDTDQVVDTWTAFNPGNDMQNPQVSGDRVLFDYDTGGSTGKDILVWDVRVNRTTKLPFSVENQSGADIWEKMSGNSFVYLSMPAAIGYPYWGKLLVPSISANTLASHLGSGHTAKLKGTLTDQGVPLGGVHVRIEKKSGSKWNLVKTLTTSSSGTYSWTSPKIYATAYYRAAYDGNYAFFDASAKSHMSAVSAERRARP